MTEELAVLGRRLVKHPAWRGLEGSKVQHKALAFRHAGELLNRHMVYDGQCGLVSKAGHVERIYTTEAALALPDLSDPATLGALLGWVQGLYKDPDLFVARSASGWSVWRYKGVKKDGSRRVALADTYAEALVKAAETWETL